MNKKNQNQQNTNNENISIINDNNNSTEISNKNIPGKPYKNNYSSIITNRLKVSKTIDTTYSQEEEENWQNIKYNLSLEEQAKKKQIIGCISLFVIMIVALILLLIWWFNKYYSFLFK